jgi:hypothetical protein
MATPRFNRFNGETMFHALPRQNTGLRRPGYFIRAIKLTPFVQWPTRGLVDDTFATRRTGRLA